MIAENDSGVSASAPAINNSAVGLGEEKTLPTSVGGVAVSAPTSAAGMSGTSAGGVFVSTPTSTTNLPLEAFKDHLKCQENPFSTLSSRQLKKLLPESELETFSKEVRKSDIWITESSFSVTSVDTLLRIGKTD